MAKGIVFLGLFSICTIAMFCLMVYLMTTINPPPLEPYVVVLRTPATPIPVSYPRQKFDHIVFDVGGSVPVMDPALYGLDKEVEEIDFYPVTIRHVTNIHLQNITGVYRFTRRKLLQPLWPRTLQTIMIGPTMHKVMPPIWPTLSSEVIVDTTSPINSAIKPTEAQKTTNSFTNKTFEKPMKRRSVSNKLDDYSGSVLLKILDNNGQPRIEIKLGSDNFIQNKSKSDNIYINNKNIGSGDNSIIVKDNEFTKDTVITIMSNNTVVLDEIDDKETKQRNLTGVDTDLISSLILDAKTDEYDKETSITDPENKLLLNITEMILSYGNISVKLMFQNKRRFNVNKVSNSFNCSNNKTDAKNNTEIDTKNNNDFDDITDKFNDTKFIKSVFKVEEKNNFKGAHEIVSNYTTNVSTEQTTKNGTNAFIKNDSDIHMF